MRNRELTGRFLGEQFVFGEGERRCVVGGVMIGKDKHTVRGYSPDGELQAGMTYRFYGHTKTHPKYGDQFQFNSFTIEKPADDESLVAYLLQCRGPQKGSITERVAWALVETFGGECIDVVLNRPAEAAAGIGRAGTRWDAEKALLASQHLRLFENSRAAKVELLGLLDGRGFPKKTPDRCLKKWGTAAPRMIAEDAFCLTALPGIGFKGADKMFCDLARKNSATTEEYQQALAAIKRQALCAAYAVKSDRSGSTWVSRRTAELAIRQNVANTLAKPDEAIRWAVAKGYLAERTHGGDWLAVATRAEHETEVAAAVNDLLSRDDIAWPTELRSLSEHQSAEVAKALRRRVGVLRGSPGCGKTYTMAYLVEWLIDNYGSDSVAIACPTGKAAVRATQAMVTAGVSVVATTIHRMLVVEKGEDGDWSFFHNDSNPLPYRFIVVDESSMIDLDLMASLLRACSEDVHLLLTGDAEQLAPVGHGRPFLDLQEIVPTGSLTEIRRNSGRIVQACAEIRDTKRFTPSKTYDEAAGENLPWIECKEDDLQDTVLGLVQQIERGGECNPIWDVQILTACNMGTPVSRKVLNPKVQDMLNPNGAKCVGNPFRVGDKIVCLKNGGYWLTPGFMAMLSGYDSEMVGEDQLFKLPDGQTLLVGGDNNEVYVANGELAEVLEIEPAKMLVKLFDPPREVTVPYQPVREDERGIEDDSENESKGAVGDWDLGYVLSNHKSQGSQWQYVVWICDPSSRARNVQTRNLVYTGISRASRATFCVGEIAVAQAACRRDGLAGRKTFLIEQIRWDKAAKGGLLAKLREPV